MVDHPLRYRVVIKPVVAREAPYNSPDPEVDGLEKVSVRDWKYVVSHRNVAEKKGGKFGADTANRFEFVMSERDIVVMEPLSCAGHQVDERASSTQDAEHTSARRGLVVQKVVLGICTAADLSTESVPSRQRVQ
jgi:hypothetical protein